MKRITGFIFLFVNMIATCAQITIDSDQIITDYFNAIGGIEKLKSIKEYSAFGKVDGMNYENHLTFNKKLQVIFSNEVFKNEINYNSGEIRVVTNDSSYALIDELAIKDYELECWIFPLAFKHLVKNIELEETTIIGTKEFHNLLIEFKNGVTWSMLIDKKTNLPLKKTTSSGLTLTYEKYESHGNIDGVLFPTHIKIEDYNSEVHHLLLEEISCVFQK